MSEKTTDPMKTEPSLLWSMYTQAPMPHELVDLPVNERFPLIGNMPKIAMVPINIEDALLCQAEADDFAKKHMLKSPPKEGEQNAAYGTIFDTCRTVNVLWRACRDPNDLKKKIFPTPAAMRMSLTQDQISILALAYLRVERLLSPIRSLMTKEEMDGFLMRLREGGRSAPLDWLSSELLRDLLLHSVVSPLASPSPSTSPGSPPDRSGTPPSAEGAPEEPPTENRVEEEPLQDAVVEAPPKPTYDPG
jgi:hypothetical protein